MESPMQAVLRAVRSHEQEMLAELRALVELESPSSEKALVDLCGVHLRESFERLGGHCTLLAVEKYGDHLQVDFPGRAGGKPVMLLGHFDTVYDAGTLHTMPWKIADGRAYGPGVYDMKHGIVQMIYAIASLKKVHGELPRPVRVFLVTDEEVGSESSRPFTETLAKEYAAVLVCEPSQTIEGAIKTWRKGVGDYLVRVRGVASHAGVDFEKGQSAIVELARQIEKISTFTDLERGITVNPGVIRGGTRGNVVAAEAEVEVDVRIMKLEDAAVVEQKFRELHPVNPHCKIEISGGINRPPMERSEKVVKLFGIAQQVAGEIGFEVQEKGTGGGSDGNFTAALGIPTLDGLGAVGEGAHAKHESVLLEHFVPRTALLAGLIERVPPG
jgi:glutamate carboxypeptidase